MATKRATKYLTYYFKCAGPSSFPSSVSQSATYPEISGLHIGHTSVKIEFDVTHCIYRKPWHAAPFYLLQIFSTSAQLTLYVHIQHSYGDTIHSVFHHVHSTYIMLTTTVVTYIMQNISKTKDRVELLQPSVST